MGGATSEVGPATTRPAGRGGALRPGHGGPLGPPAQAVDRGQPPVRARRRPRARAVRRASSSSGCWSSTAAARPTPTVTDVGEREPRAGRSTLPADLPSRLVGARLHAGAGRAARSRPSVLRSAVASRRRRAGRSRRRRGGRTCASPVDLVEEVARLEGYDQIPSVLPVAPPGRGLTAGPAGPALGVADAGRPRAASRC